MHSSQLQLPARLAICSLLETDEAQSKELLEKIQKDLFEKKD